MCYLHHRKVKNEHVYIGVPEGDWKQRYGNYTMPFKNASPLFEWEVINCQLPDQKQLLNKRSELIAKCRQEKKFLLINYKANNQFVDSS